MRLYHGNHWQGNISCSNEVFPADFQKPLREVCSLMSLFQCEQNDCLLQSPRSRLPPPDAWARPQDEALGRLPSRCPALRVKNSARERPRSGGKQVSGRGGRGRCWAPLELAKGDFSRGPAAGSDPQGKMDPGAPRRGGDAPRDWPAPEVWYWKLRADWRPAAKGAEPGPAGEAIA